MPVLEDDAGEIAVQLKCGAEELRRMIEHAGYLLPTQGPIEVFVYRNTLEVFEEQSFHDALKSGQSRYKGNPYLSENAYRQFLADGRISVDDLKAIIDNDLGEHEREQIDHLGTRSQIRLAMLQHPVHVGSDAELRWIIFETDALELFRPELSKETRARLIDSARKWLQNHNPEDDAAFEELAELRRKFGKNFLKWKDAAWESFSLRLLWRTCCNGVQSIPTKQESFSFVRPRDLLLHAIGNDIDRNVHSVLIRFCAAFVDQGYSDWPLPNREQGFFESFIALFAQPGRATDRWMRGLQQEVQSLLDSGTTAEQSVDDSLQQMGIPVESREELIIQTLMSLRGWAGMIWQLESGVDWVVHKIPPGSLLGLLAVQLILERHAIFDVGEDVLNYRGSVPEIVGRAKTKQASVEPLSVERRAFLLFQVAQTRGWEPRQLQSLSNDDWRELFHEVESFSGMERRRVFQEAYERKYRNAALDALNIHATRRRELAAKQEPRRPDFQVLTCIDDREESFRRRIEEVHANSETFGAAGFFAVVMYFRGIADGFYKPLCPIVVTPRHFVQEDVGYTFEGVHRSRAELRRRLGLVSHAFHTRSRTFLGGMFAGILGSLATIPLVARVLFPHLTFRIRRSFGSLLRPPPVTKLQLERDAADPGPDNSHVGFTVKEMAAIVVKLLQELGVTKPESFSRLFIVCGHGSSSLNNPHESSYCCGACAGKRGGPNARAFAQMANDWRVRSIVAESGITIPPDTTFIGAYHDTCNDSVVYYDLDRLPNSHRPDFDVARKAIGEALKRNAHERCRRFVRTPLDLTYDEALYHVEGRGQDLAQVRPEYDHATNSMCFVGRRDWSRGLFLDRRAFLNSYDSRQDDEDSSILLRILSAAIPVCSGINLAFYFSTVDNVVFGSGSKLPHNLSALLGVMEGTSSDLRTGMYQQVCEIHEPMRLLFVIETTAAAMLSIMDRHAVIGRICRGHWIHLAVIDPETSEIQVFENGEFVPYEPSTRELATLKSSLECYQGSRDHLPFFSIAETEVAS